MRASVSALLVLAAQAAGAEELSEVSVRNLAYCAIYAREAARIDLVHNDFQVANVKDIETLAVNHYKQCVSVLPTLLALPEGHRNLSTWLNDMWELKLPEVGTAPATDDYEAQCAAEYRTWDPETKTVIRYGSPERVPCPCGKEVNCGS